MFSCEKKEHSPRKELSIGVSQDYRATDVFSHKGFNCLVFETLVKMDKKGEARPLLAESWEISEDGRRYTFHLRKDVTFSDGTPLTAWQVKESMFYKKTRPRRRGPARGSWGDQNKGPKGEKPWGESKGGSESTKSWEAVRKGPEAEKPSGEVGKGPGSKKPWGEDATDIDREYGTFDNERYNLPRWYSFESIDVIDDHTLRFNLPLPYTLFLHELATTHMYPVLKVDDSEEVTGYIGTGPYKIDEHKRTQYMILVKNRNYWQGDVGIERIRLKVIHDADTRAIALEAGEIDVTGYDHFDKIPNESVTRLKNLSFVTIKTMGCPDQPSVSFIVINYKRELFKNPDVRKAIALAINRKQINKIISETGRTINGPFPEDHKLYNADIETIEFDPDKAKRLLSTAGWADKNNDGILDKDGKSFSIALTFSFFDPQYKVIAEIVQAQLKDIGIETKLQMLELGAHITVMRNAEYDLACWPMMRYHMFYYTGHPSWLNVYNSESLDNAFTRCLHVKDKEENPKAVRETQRLIRESHIFPLFFERFDVVAWNHERVKNLVPLPVGWDLSMGLWKARLE